MTDKTIINNWTGGGTLQTWADGEWQILYAKDAAGNCITLSLNSSEACRLAYAVSPQPSEQFRRMREYMHAVYELSHPDARADELRQIAGEIECSSRCERCPADQPDRGEFCGFVAADSLRKLATALDLKAKINVEDQPAPSEARLREALEPALIAADLHADSLTNRLEMRDWTPKRAHIEQARNTIRNLVQRVNEVVPTASGGSDRCPMREKYETAAQPATSAVGRGDGPMPHGPATGDGQPVAAVGSNPATATNRPSDPTAAERREIVARIIHTYVGSKSDPNFVERRWLTGVDDAADAILAVLDGGTVK